MFWEFEELWPLVGNYIKNLAELQKMTRSIGYIYYLFSENCSREKGKRRVQAVVECYLRVRQKCVEVADFFVKCTFRDNAS